MSKRLSMGLAGLVLVVSATAQTTTTSGTTGGTTTGTSTLINQGTYDSKTLVDTNSTSNSTSNSRCPRMLFLKNCTPCILQPAWTAQPQPACHIHRDPQQRPLAPLLQHSCLPPPQNTSLSQFATVQFQIQFQIKNFQKFFKI